MTSKAKATRCCGATCCLPATPGAATSRRTAASPGTSAGVVPLQLTDARFYHLDTAFTVVDNQTVALYPAAFTPQSVQAVRDIVPNVIEASEADAQAYGLNALSDGCNIVLSDLAVDLATEYRRR